MSAVVVFSCVPASCSDVSDEEGTLQTTVPEDVVNARLYSVAVDTHGVSRTGSCVRYEFVTCVPPGVPFVVAEMMKCPVPAAAGGVPTSARSVQKVCSEPPRLQSALWKASRSSSVVLLFHGVVLVLTKLRTVRS